MAHFARINTDNIVEEVIVVANEDCGGGSFPASEPIGQTFIASLGLTGQWLQTSYNSNFRHTYALPGSEYRSEQDIFVRPKPYPSWVLNSNYDWVAPVPCPTEGYWTWDEAAGDWVEIPAGS